jgi:transposase
LTSIPGIGRQNALNFILFTNNFKDFHSANHLACYAGVVPFPNQSGGTIKKDRVSKLANHKLKKLLHMAAMSCIRAHGDLKEYYIRKVKEGKNKMLVINALRNKLAHRMFAVIKRQTPYVNQISDPAILAGS